MRSMPISQRCILILIVLSAFFPGVMMSPPLFAEVTPDNTLESDTSEPKYPVILGGEVLFYIPRTRAEISPKARADTISKRISEAADNPMISFKKIIARDFNDPSTVVIAGNEYLFAVLNEDAELAGTSRQELARKLSETVKTSVLQYRKKRHIKNIIKGAVIFVAETILLILLLLGVRRLYAGSTKKLNGWMDAKKEYLESQELAIVRIDKIRVLLSGALKACWCLVIIGILYIYIQMGLSLFPWTQAIATRLFGFVIHPLTTIAKALWSQVPNLFFLVVITLITLYILKLMRMLFHDIETGEIKIRKFYPEWAQPTHGAFRIMIIAFALVVAFPYIPGSNSLAFKGISIFFGVLLSLGSSTAVANILAGYMIIYRRIFTVGDRIKINEIIGDVIETQLQVIHLRTLKNEDLSVPNSLVVNSQVLNYSSLAKKRGLILHTTVSIGYDTPWRQVHAMLHEAADNVKGIMKHPAPFVLQKSLDDFYVTYELNVYTRNPEKMGAIYSALHQEILDVFNQNNVQIMSPHYINDKNEPVVVNKEQWYAHPAKEPVT